MDSTQRAASGIDIGDHGAECCELIRISDYVHVFSDSFGKSQGMRQQRLPGEFQEGLIGTHASALAAGEDEGRDGFHIAIIQRRLRMQVSPSEELAARAARAAYTKVTYPFSEFRWMMNLPTLASQVIIMPQKLLDVLRLGRCSHEFSWPRRAADGHYYQVCLL